jgi:hypothetical protein
MKIKKTMDELKDLWLFSKSPKLCLLLLCTTAATQDTQAASMAKQLRRFMEGRFMHEPAPSDAVEAERRMHESAPLPAKGVPFIALDTQTPSGVVNYLFVATSYVGCQDNKRQP